MYVVLVVRVPETERKRKRKRQRERVARVSAHGCILNGEECMFIYLIVWYLQKTWFSTITPFNSHLNWMWACEWALVFVLFALQALLSPHRYGFVSLPPGEPVKRIWKRNSIEKLCLKHNSQQYTVVTLQRPTMPFWVHHHYLPFPLLSTALGTMQNVSFLHFVSRLPLRSISVNLIVECRTLSPHTSSDEQMFLFVANEVCHPGGIRFYFSCLARFSGLRFRFEAVISICRLFERLSTCSAWQEVTIRNIL